MSQVTLPESAVQMVDGDETAARCAATIAERFFSDRWPPQGTGRGRYVLLQWQLKERWRDRVRYAAGRTLGRVWFGDGAVRHEASAN